MLASLRRLHNLSQRELGQHAGRSARTVSNIECGRHEPRVGTARALARALGYPVAAVFPELFTEADDSSVLVLKLRDGVALPRD